MTVRPILDRILIKQDSGKEVVGTIEIPNSEIEKPHSGVVVAVGPGWRASTTGELVPMTVKVGDRVIYSEFATTEIDVNGEIFVLIKEGDLLVIL